MQRFSQINNQRILLSFLNWGKGHLSRSIGICRKLSAQNNTLYIACTEDDFAIVQQYVLPLNHIPFSGYPFNFKEQSNFTVDLWKSRKALSQFMLLEQKNVEEIVKQHQIDLVLSDHRYGFKSQKIPSIFITHQVNLPLKWWQFPAQLIHHKWMKSFDGIWIMDDHKKSLAGKLSANTQFKNHEYIGHFSRFNKEKCKEKTINLGVCNGPFPYNKQLLEQLIQNNKLDVIITDLSSTDKRVINPKNWIESDEYFYQAKCIYGYCGYSTLMDSKLLECETQLIPTKGQLEQEYLYQLHKMNSVF